MRSKVYFQFFTKPRWFKNFEQSRFRVVAAAQRCLRSYTAPPAPLSPGSAWPSPLRERAAAQQPGEGAFYRRLARIEGPITPTLSQGEREFRVTGEAAISG